MLQRKPVNRLGYNGINEIKDHPWVKYYPWKDLYEKNLEAPFVPKNIDNFDKKYCEGPDKIGNETLERYQNYYKNESLNEIFLNYSYENILTQNAKHDSNKKASIQNSNHNTYINNINNANLQKKRINSSLSNLSMNKNSLNSLLKNKMKVTESLYINNNLSGNIQFNNVIKNTPLKNRTNSMNINNNINTPLHIRNMSSNSNLNNNLLKDNNALNSNHGSNNLAAGSTPNKIRSLNSLNLLKNRGKNLSINNSTNVSSLNLANSSALNNNQINVSHSSSILNLKQPLNTPYRAGEKGNEKLPLIEKNKLLASSKQFSSNISIPKKFLNSPSLKSGLSSNNIQNNQKNGTKYTTLSANSTGSSTISMNFLHRRTGSTNNFNNY